MNFKMFAVSMTLLLSTTLSYGATTKLACINHGGGYLSQIAKITENDDGSISFQLERYSKFPGMEAQTGFKIGNDTVRRIDTTFQKGACQFATSKTLDVTLLVCNSGIYQVPAQLTLTDGTTKEITLRDNNRVSATLHSEEHLTWTQHTLKIETSLGERNYDQNGLGFAVIDGPLSNCKSN